MGLRTRFLNLPNLVKMLAKSKNKLIQSIMSEKTCRIMQDVLLHNLTKFDFSHPKIELLDPISPSYLQKSYQISANGTNQTVLDENKNFYITDLPQKGGHRNFRVLDQNRKVRHSFINKNIDLPNNALHMLTKIINQDIPDMI